MFSWIYSFVIFLTNWSINTEPIYLRILSIEINVFEITQVLKHGNKVKIVSYEDRLLAETLVEKEGSSDITETSILCANCYLCQLSAAKMVQMQYN